MSPAWECDGGHRRWVKDAGFTPLVVCDGREVSAHLCVGAQLSKM